MENATCTRTELNEAIETGKVTPMLVTLTTWPHAGQVLEAVPAGRRTDGTTVWRAVGTGIDWIPLRGERCE
jgi:hypothetical protein